MRTVLLITESPDTHRLLAELIGQDYNIITMPAPVEASRERFDALFATWLRLAESVVVDAVSLGEACRWAIESLAAASLEEHQAVVVRATATQQSLFSTPGHWLLVSDKDSYDQLKQSLRNYLDLRRTRARLKQADEAIARQRQGIVLPAVAAHAQGLFGPALPMPAPGSQFDLFQYRDALKSISRVLGQHPDERTLLTEFFRLVRELLGVGRLAIFMRPVHAGLFQGFGGPEGRHMAVAVSTGISAEVVEHLRLTTDSGIGGYLAREAKILLRARLRDPLALDYDSQITREFELLGTEVAVPIYDNDQLLGILTFSGKITGEPVTHEDLELVYHLMTHLAQATRNLHLLNQVAGHQRFMRELLANVQSGVVVISQEGRILSANHRASELLELGERDVVGQPINRLPPRVADAIFEALQTGQEIRRREVTLTPSNRILSVSATRFAVSLNGASSEKTSLVAVGLVDDLTQAKLQEEQGKELEDKAFFMRLAFRLSHELANAMVSIKTFVQLLPERAEEQEFCEQFSREVLRDIRRMDSVINTLAFFAHPLELVCEDVELPQLIDLALRNVVSELERNKAVLIMDAGGDTSPGAPDQPVIQVRKTYGPRSARLQGDRIRLIQAFEHLIRNAVQAMPTGGRLNIAADEAGQKDCEEIALPAGGAIRIEWQDSGVGIPLDELKGVTEPFVTKRNVGVGLGLTIVKRIVEQHGGRLTIDSLLGRGTTITVLLPVKVPQLSARPTAARGRGVRDTDVAAQDAKAARGAPQQTPSAT